MANAKHPKTPHSTKCGPGRRHKQGQRKINSARWRPGGLGEFGKTLRDAYTALNLAAIKAREARR